MTRVTRRHVLPAALITALAVLAIAATPAMAAKRKVPFGFFGTVFNVEADQASRSAAAKDAQMALMARSGVESLRVFFAWPDIEPQQGVYNWAHMDQIVGAGGAPSDLDPGERAGNPAVGLATPERGVPTALPAA